MKSQFLAWLHLYGMVKYRDGWGPIVLTKGQERAIAELDFFDGAWTCDLVVKARQVGFTTLLMLWSIWRCVTHAGAAILWVTPCEDPTGFEILHKFRELVAAMRNQEGSGVEWLDLDNRRETLFPNMSRISWHHVGGSEGTADMVARSGTFDAIIFTEWAFLLDAEFGRIAQEAIDPVIEKNRIPTIYDSTPNGIEGRGEVYYGVCQDILRQKKKGKVILIGWWEDPSYIDPVDEGARAAELTGEEEALRSRLGLGLGQIAWRRRVRGSTRDSIRKFNRAYPEDFEAAFSSDEDGDIFPVAVLVEASRNLKSGMGRAMDAEDLRRAGLERVCASDILFCAEFNRRGFFRAWIPPSLAGACVAAIDGSDGRPGSDWQVCAVVGDLGRVCCLLRARMDPIRFAAYCQRILRWYSADLKRVVIEQQFGVAIASYLRRSVTVVDLPGASLEEMTVLSIPFIAPFLIQATNEEIHDEAIGHALRIFEMPGGIPDLEMVAEIRDLRRGRNGRIRSRIGAHDDSIMAVGLAELERRRLALRLARSTSSSSSREGRWLKKKRGGALRGKEGFR